MCLKANKYKNAIGIIKACGLNIKGDKKLMEQVKQIENTIIEALEKQIPKKPMHTPDNHNWFCPTCHNPIKLGRNHCCNCGQKIGYGSDTE